MKTDRKTRHVREVAAERTVVRARRPFKVVEQEKRRFIRLEIAAPMSLRRIKGSDGHYRLQDDSAVIHGLILNLSAGGVLVDLDQALDEGDVVSMHFTLQETECLENVLGLVKRVDIDAEGCLAGIEFVTRELLTDRLSHAEMELLGDEHTNFNNSVRQVLGRYVSRETAATGA
jgi:hypothetical protein